MNEKNDFDEKIYLSGLYTRIAPLYDQVGFKAFSYYFGKRLVELIEIPENAKVLDIATGRGASLFPSTKRVGPRGSVNGIDIADGMVKETTKDIAKSGYSYVKILKMDAENLKFDDNTFDFILCGLSIFLFPHSEIALNEAFRVLKPDGRIGITTFCPGYSSGYSITWQKGLILRYMTKSRMKDEELKMLLKLKAVEKPEFKTAEGMKKIMTKANFKEVNSLIEEKEFICNNAEEWWNFLWSTGSRSVLEKMSTANLMKLKEETINKFNNVTLEDGLHQVIKVLFTFGTK